jgi:uncharacterized protein (DUF58 family)
MSQSSQLQDSELIEFAKMIEIASTEVLEGMHHALRGGEGVEYHSTMPYMEGEDARRVDWKRYAATDRLFINRYEREEKTSWTLLIDSSDSMSYRKKTEWASLWSGAILFIAKVWGDRWCLLPDPSIPFDEALRILSQRKAGVRQPEKIALEGRATERLIVISDFFWEKDRLVQALEKWKTTYAHVYLIQTLDSKEAEFDFSGVLEFRDLESSDKLILDSGKIASRYRKALKKLQADLQDSIASSGFLKTFEADPTKIKEQLLMFFEAM